MELLIINENNKKVCDIELSARKILADKDIKMLAMAPITFLPGIKHIAMTCCCIAFAWDLTGAWVTAKDEEERRLLVKDACMRFALAIAIVYGLPHLFPLINNTVIQAFTNN